jgi:hypothetical protein
MPASDSTSAPLGRFVSVQGRNLMAPNGNMLLLQGINLGNWLLTEGYMFHFDRAVASWQINHMSKELLGPSRSRALWQQWLDLYITQDDIKYIKHIGMNCIRLPFDYRCLTPEDGPTRWLDAGFALIDRVVTWAEAAGLYVLLDMHAAPGDQVGEGIGNSRGYPWVYEDPESQDRTAEVWCTVAQRYRDNPTIIGYDLLNAPIPPFDEYKALKPMLEPLYKKIIAAIRTVDPHHVIFLSAGDWGSAFDMLNGTEVDDQLVYAFQFYFKEPSKDALRDFLAFRDRYDVPLFLVEAGENTNEWVHALRQLVEDEQIGWAFWPYKKMDSPSSVVTFDKPVHWEEIIRYQSLIGASFEEQRKGRPLQAQINAAFDDLVNNIRFDHRRVNADYVRALGKQP